MANKRIMLTPEKKKLKLKLEALFGNSLQTAFKCKDGAFGVKGQND